MNLGIYTFASGSGGNCYLIKSEGANILVDMGISNKKITLNLRELNILPSMLNGVFLTHDHGDHVKGIQTFRKQNPSVPIFSSEGTMEGLIERYRLIIDENFHTVEGGAIVDIGDVTAKVFNLSHDVYEAVGFSFIKNEKKISIVTDTGYISEEIYENIKDSDILLLEANHEVNFLLYGSYPYQLKQRILSDRGHLSNEASANCILRILKELKGRKKPYIILAHLSKENNTPLQAYITVKNMLEEAGFFEGADFELKVAEREALSEMVVV